MSKKLHDALGEVWSGRKSPQDFLSQLENELELVERQIAQTAQTAQTAQMNGRATSPMAHCYQVALLSYKELLSELIEVVRAEEFPQPEQFEGFWPDLLKIDEIFDQIDDLSDSSLQSRDYGLT